MTLEEFNSSSETALRKDLLQVCHSEQWVTQVLKARPFATLKALKEQCSKVWKDLTPNDWLEAFAAHPAIGEKGEGFSQEEQKAALTQDEKVQQALREANLAYQKKFGHVFLICASGLPATTILEELHRRLPRSPKEELNQAMEEQDKITHLRLEKWIHVKA